jgi:ABC-type polysaccharide/polyol phosphate export permease
MTAVRSTAGDLQLVVPHRTIRDHLRDIWAYRELLVQLVRRELKVKYKNSSLGFVWSMLNPAFLLAVYFLVFKILGNALPLFALWLICGLLVWNFFSTALGGATGSITGNSYLVGKVRFPREILPLSVVGAFLVHFFLQAVVLVGAVAVFGRGVAWTYLPLVPLALITMVVLVSSVAMFLSAINVYARDTQHLQELVILGWFWLTPILYDYGLVSGKLKEWDLPSWLPLINPVTSIVIVFQRTFYNATAIPERAILPDGSPFWYLRNLAIVFVIALGLFIAAIKVFDKAEGGFAEVM